MEDEHSHSPSLKTKLKQTLCLSCCFSTTHRQILEPSSSSSSSDTPKFPRSASTWIKTAPDFPEIKDKCRSIFSQIGKHHHHRRHSSADFRYDPLSYSLNFDDGYDNQHLDEAPLKNVTSKFVASPPLKSVAETREITTVS